MAVKQLKETGVIKRRGYKRFKNMCIKDGLLVKDDKVVVPNSMRYEITNEHHDRMGHVDTKKTTDFVHRKFMWVGMQEYIRDYCAHCEICLRNKSSRDSKVPLEDFADPPSKPRQQIAFDIATLPWSSNSQRYFLLVIDMYSRYIELIPMANQEAITLKVSLLQNWIYRHGKPKVALSDQAKNVDGEVMRKLCESLEIDKKHSSPYHPEGDGMAERAIQTVKSLLRCVLEEEEVSVYKWPDLLQQVAFVFNASTSVSTGKSPHEVMYGDAPNLPLTIMTNSHEGDTRLNTKTYCEELRCRLDQIWREVGDRLQVQKQKQAEYYNTGKKDKVVDKGDLVYIKDLTRANCLSPKFVGPFKVMWRKGPNVKVMLSANKEKVIHLNNCKVITESQFTDTELEHFQAANQPDEIPPTRVDETEQNSPTAANGKFLQERN